MKLDPTPLLDYLGEISASQAASLLGVTTRTIVRWRTRETGIDPNHADQFAIAAGTVAYDLWPELLDHAIAELERTCETCNDRYIPKVSTQRFCSTRCKNAHPTYRAHRSKKANAARKARRASDPAWVEQQRQYARDYRAASRRRAA